MRMCGRKNDVASIFLACTRFTLMVSCTFRMSGWYLPLWGSQQEQKNVDLNSSSFLRYPSLRVPLSYRHMIYSNGSLYFSRVHTPSLCLTGTWFTKTVPYTFGVFGCSSLIESLSLAGTWFTRTVPCTFRVFGCSSLIESFCLSGTWFTQTVPCTFRVFGWPMKVPTAVRPSAGTDRSGRRSHRTSIWHVRTLVLLVLWFGHGVWSSSIPFMIGETGYRNPYWVEMYFIKLTELRFYFDKN